MLLRFNPNFKLSLITDFGDWDFEMLHFLSSSHHQQQTLVDQTAEASL